MTATGWKVLGLLTVDGIVRWRNLLFKQQNSRHSSTADEALAAWGSTVKRLVEGASSSRSGEVACDDDELRVAPLRVRAHRHARHAKVRALANRERHDDTAVRRRAAVLSQGVEMGSRLLEKGRTTSEGRA